MGILVTEVSKYLICLVMLLYVIESFAALLYSDLKKERSAALRMRIWMFLIGVLFFAQTAANTGSLDHLAYFAGLFILIIITPSLYNILFKVEEPLIINHMCMLLMIGMTIILRVDTHKALRQLIIVYFSIFVGLIGLWIIRKIDIAFEKYGYVYLFAGIAAILVVLVLGSITYGSHLSIKIFGLTFQPSEFVKLLLVLFSAGMLYEKQDMKHVAISGAGAAAEVLILALSKDLGAALIYFVVYIFILYVASGKAIYPFLGAVFGTAAGVASYFIFDHVKNRVTVFIDPWSHISSGGYQVGLSLFAISAGGFFGLGLFNGNPSVIPHVEEDVIFSAIAEELGFIFAMLMLAVCIAVFLVYMRAASRSTDKFKRLVYIGLGVQYIFQIFLTVGGGTKFIPLTGVTLSLVSYGGSSVLSTIFSISLFEGLRSKEKYDEAEYEEGGPEYETSTGKKNNQTKRLLKKG